MKIISSGDTRLEIYKTTGYDIFVNTQTNNSEGRKGKIDLEQEDKVENQDRARRTTLNNARNNIIRLIKSNEDMKTFITLTLAKDSNYKESKKFLQAMFLKLNRHYSSFKYLWVLEFGEKTERLHYHMLCNLELPGNIKFAASGRRKGKDHKAYENSFAKKYWKKGFVDIRNLDEEGNSNIALYVSCYITKDLLNKELEGFRLYGYSNKTLNKPLVFNAYTEKEIAAILKDFNRDYDITYSNSYEIGYKDGFKERKGLMTYVDLKLR